MPMFTLINLTSQALLTERFAENGSPADRMMRADLDGSSALPPWCWMHWDDDTLILEQRGLTRAAAAKLMGVTQPSSTIACRRPPRSASTAKGSETITTSRTTAPAGAS